MATLVEGDQKAPFLIATTLRCRKGCYSFPWIALLYPWYCWALSKEVSSTIFKVFGMMWPGIEPRVSRTIGELSTHGAPLMVLFCDLVSLLEFLFISHVHIFTCVILPVWCLKYPYSCFPSHFCFLVFLLFFCLFICYYCVYWLLKSFFLYSF